MCSHFANWGHVNDSILILKSRDELVKGIGVGNAVDLDMGRESSLGRRAGEDLDVACKARIRVERGENRWTEVARGLNGVLGVVNTESIRRWGVYPNDDDVLEDQCHE